MKGKNENEREKHGFNEFVLNPSKIKTTKLSPIKYFTGLVEVKNFIKSAWFLSIIFIMALLMLNIPWAGCDR